MTTYVRKPKEFPDTPGPTEQEILSWEERRGVSLDPEYRFFLKSYNGGFIFPEIFTPEFSDDHPYYEDYDRDDVIDGLHNWETFIQLNSSTQPYEAKSFVEIGYSMNGAILSRVTDPDRGSIFLWCRNSEFWIERQSLEVMGRISSSFRSFIETALRKDDDGHSSRWFHPSHFESAQKIMFPDP